MEYNKETQDKLHQALTELLGKCIDATVGKLHLENEDEEFGALSAVGHIFRSPEGQQAYNLLQELK